MFHVTHDSSNVAISHLIVSVLACHASDQVEHVFRKHEIPLLLLIKITIKLLLLIVVASRGFQRGKHSRRWIGGRKTKIAMLLMT